MHNLGITAHLQGDYGRAAALHEESLALARKLGNGLQTGNDLYSLGEVATAQGDYRRAAAFFEEALALFRTQGNPGYIGMGLQGVAEVLYRQGEYEGAAAALREAIGYQRDVGNYLHTAEILEMLAEIACAQGQIVRAARLFGAAVGVQEAINAVEAPRAPYERAIHEEALAVTHAALGEQAFAVAWAEGQAMTFDQATDYAFADTDAELPHVPHEHSNHGALNRKHPTKSE